MEISKGKFIHASIKYYGVFASSILDLQIEKEEDNMAHAPQPQRAFHAEEQTGVE
jgi:hypothetical protein